MSANHIEILPGAHINHWSDISFTICIKAIIPSARKCLRVFSNEIMKLVINEDMFMSVYQNRT